MNEQAVVLLNRLLESFDRYSNKAAICDLERAFTYKELARQSLVVAERLGECLGEISPTNRPRVLLSDSNSCGLAVTFIACLRAGIVPLLADPSLGIETLKDLARQCGANAMITTREVKALLNQPTVLPFLDQTAADQQPLASTAFCRFTSGSTRLPACIEFSGVAAVAAAEAWRRATAMHADDRILCLAGMYNGLCFNTSFIPGLLSGSSIVLAPSMVSTSFLGKLIERFRPTTLVAFPAIYSAMAESSAHLSPQGVRHAISSAAQLDPNDHSLLQDKYGLRVINYYGIAEVGPVTFNAAGEPDTVGKALLGAEVKFVSVDKGFDELHVDQEEILVRTAYMGSRYLNYPDEFEQRLTKDGFYKSGDLGRRKADSLVLEGRVDKMLNIGGRKVSAAVVADRLKALADVDDAVVFALPTRRGDRLAAVLQSRKVNLDQVRRMANETIEERFRPEFLTVVESIPRGGAGKPSSAKLKDLFKSISSGGKDD